MKILVTGTAGFIGYYLVKRLLETENEIVGIDNINNYYDVSLKLDRLKDTGITGTIDYNIPIKSNVYPNYTFIKINLEDKDTVMSLFEREGFDVVVNLAAQAGVRYSLENPYTYLDSNIYGFLNILEACRHHPVKHLVYASSSSVYGLNTKMPFSVDDMVDNPISLYAATKKSNELFAHTYSHLYGIPVTGLRFFTVYGPWGRPDMACFIFANAIISNQEIKLFNNGDMMRDFTYIDDIIEGVVRVMNKIPKPNSTTENNSSMPPYKLYNIGNNNPVKLMDFVDIMEKAFGKQAKKVFMPMQPGDVYATYADVDALKADVGYSPNTPIEAGIGKFAEWYKNYYTGKQCLKQ